jgi:hypothetical protein
MDAETADLLRESLRRALTGLGAADSALAAVGWRDALLAEGTGVVPLLFVEQGRANAASSALDDLLTVGFSLDTDVAFVLPAFGAHAPPGRADAALLTVQGLGTGRMLTADQAVVVAPDRGGHRAYVVPTRSLRIEPIGGLDPAHGLVRVEGEIPALAGNLVDGPVDWPHLAATAQLALAYELIGASRAMLALAREHALTRVQFGRPISAFQAVRHRLADSLVAIETADAAATSALESAAASLPAPISPLLAGMAKAVAGRGGRTVARHCQQVLAGLGFTTEHAFHRYLRRVLTVDGLFGDARTLTRELGEELLRSRRLPAAPAL